MTIAAVYLGVAVTVAALDVMWLGFLMKGFYATRLSHLLAPSFSVYAAVAFYLVYAAGVLYFAVLPSGESLLRAAMLGAGLGLFAYATYDLTNMATLRDWPVSVTLVDILWGGVLTAAAASVGVYLLKAIS